MATYYVWADGDNSTGADWAHAKTTLKAGIDLATTAGDIVYARAKSVPAETVAAEIDCAYSGTNAGGWIKIIGCNSSGNVDGTRYIIDGGANAINIFDFAGFDMLWLENIQVQNTGAGTKYGFYSSTATCSGHVLINCASTTCAGNGMDLSNISYSTLVRCVSFSNTVHGFNGGALGNRFLFCCANSNSSSGFVSNYIGDIFYGCISHGNTNDGWSALHPASTMINCVTDSNGNDGIFQIASTALYAPLVVGCRITNHSGASDCGISLNSATQTEPIVVGWCYFEDNTDNIYDHTATNLFKFIPIENGSTTTNEEDGADTNEGYVAAVADHNFATGYVSGSDPTLRRATITIPWT